MISDTEDNPILLWAEIHDLRAKLKGPDDFETWRDAAISERLRRVEAERKLKDAADKGPWQRDMWPPKHPGGRPVVVLQSVNGDADVALEISGNFGTLDDVLAYANHLAANLNQLSCDK